MSKHIDILLVPDASAHLESNRRLDVCLDVETCRHTSSARLEFAKTNRRLDVCLDVETYRHTSSARLEFAKTNRRLDVCLDVETYRHTSSARFFLHISIKTLTEEQAQPFLRAYIYISHIYI